MWSPEGPGATDPSRSIARSRPRRYRPPRRVRIRFCRFHEEPDGERCEQLSPATAPQRTLGGNARPESCVPRGRPAPSTAPGRPLTDDSGDSPTNSLSHGRVLPPARPEQRSVEILSRAEAGHSLCLTEAAPSEAKEHRVSGPYRSVARPANECNEMPQDVRTNWRVPLTLFSRKHPGCRSPRERLGGGGAGRSPGTLGGDHRVSAGQLCSPRDTGTTGIPVPPIGVFADCSKRHHC